MSATEFLTPAPRIGVIDKLAKDCAKLKAKGEFLKILCCFSCDAFQPINDEHQLARQAIEVLHFYGQSVCILTKGGYRALPDMPLLKEGDEFATTLTFAPGHESESVKWEPRAALPQERYNTLKEAFARGIQTWVSLEPVIDPAQSLQIIRDTHEYVDEYKLGILNYHPRAKEIDWRLYGTRAVALLKELGKAFYLKEDLRRCLKVG